MGHSCRRGCISSISPCYTDIVNLFLWIKFIVRQRAEADNLPLTPCIPELAKCLQTRGSSFPCSQQKGKLHKLHGKITGDTHLPEIRQPPPPPPT